MSKWEFLEPWLATIFVQGKAAFIETASGPASGFDFIDSSLEQLAGTVAISMCDLAEPETMGLFVTVTKTAKTQFQLSLDLWEMTGQYVQHAGSMLSLMLSGSASSLLEVFRCAQSVPLAVICWNISSYMVEPVCSAIANIKSALNVTLDLNDLVSEPISDWGWLVYAVCCGSTHSNEWNSRVSSASMTQRDLDVIDHVRKFKFPEPAIGSDMFEYGIVDMQEGTSFLHSSEDIVLVATTACHCRAARYTCTGTTTNMARIVVPGHGLCTVKIGDGAVFIRDNPTQKLFQECQSQYLRELIIYNLTVENNSLVYGLLSDRERLASTTHYEAIHSATLFEESKRV
ncbi:hypothetical protein L916_02319 [Phytophthora nicotianae]|uniref:Uncharacterized protein n=1 Tax=Phytophthora nicotianae TaxID=4792 RepID=W2JNM0_PHYNI|nr:hypothetical protein L916_02319 [Phytophthora nicotianae]